MKRGSCSRREEIECVVRSSLFSVCSVSERKEWQKGNARKHDKFLANVRNVRIIKTYVRRIVRKNVRTVLKDMCQNQQKSSGICQQRILRNIPDKDVRICYINRHVRNMSEKNVRRHVRKNMSDRLPEDMLEKDVKRYVRKEC